MHAYRFLGVSDRVLVDSDRRVAWVGHYEFDDPGVRLDAIAKVRPRNRSLLLFSSGHGWHIVSLELMDWAQKREWFEHWSSRFPGDYGLQRDNVLRLNEKNGSRPHFERFFRASDGRSHVSGFHVRVHQPRLPKDVSGYLNSPWVELIPTTGSWHSYVSSPNDVYETMLRKGEEA